MMNAALEKLTEQISDEFLTCKICFEPFKQPKCLSCLHTFCKDCIESHLFSYRLCKYSDYRDFSCPICRKKTQIPFGGVSRLQDNFIVSSLTELIGDTNGKGKITKNTCDFCSQVKNKGVDATVKCIDCQKIMCEECAQAHQENSVSCQHDCYELSMEKDVLCPDHPAEPVRYFCDDCEQCVCILCICHAANLHTDHRLTSFKQAADKRRPDIVENLKVCETKKIYTDRYINSLKNLRNRLMQVKQDIQMAAEAFQKQIIIQAEQCVEQLESRLGIPSLEILKELESMEKYNEHLNNTCSLTELMLTGREIEFLLMTKQLSEKLKVLAEDKLKPIPPEVQFDFQFVKGTLNFGDVVFSKLYQEERKIDEIAEHITDNTVATQTDLCADNTDTFNSDLWPLLGQNTIVSEEQFAENRPSISQSRQFLLCPSSQTIDNQLLTKFNNSTKRVRRIIKKNCSVATLPNKDIMILDPDCNSMSILDKRGRIKYFVSNDRFADPRLVGIGGFNSLSVSDADRSVMIHTPQGSIVISLKEPQRSSLPIGFTVHVYNSISAIGSNNTIEKSALSEQHGDLNDADG